MDEATYRYKRLNTIRSLGKRRISGHIKLKINNFMDI